MSEEIITIKTEEVKVSELQGRDKQIYDFAYNKGYNKAIDINKAAWIIVVNRIMLILAFVAVILYILYSC